MKVQCTCGADLRAPVVGEVWVSATNGAYYVVQTAPYPGASSWWGARRLDVRDSPDGCAPLYGCDPSASVAIWPSAIREQRWAWFAPSVESALAQLGGAVAETSGSTDDDVDDDPVLVRIPESYTVGLMFDRAEARAIVEMDAKPGDPFLPISSPAWVRLVAKARKLLAMSERPGGG